MFVADTRRIPFRRRSAILELPVIQAGGGEELRLPLAAQRAGFTGVVAWWDDVQFQQVPLWVQAQTGHAGQKPRRVVPRNEPVVIELVVGENSARGERLV